MLAQQGVQREPCIAERAADPDVISGLCTPAQQGLARRHFTKHGDADVQRPLCGVTAYEFALVLIGQGKQAFGKGLAPVGIGTRHGQRQREGQWLGAAGSQIAEVDGQRLVAEQLGVHIRQKVATLHQHVGRDRQLHAWCRGQQCAVVTHAEWGAAHRALEKAADQFKFTHDENRSA